MPRAWISLGANLGRPQATLTAAAKALEQSEGIAHLRLSSFYSTSPVDSSWTGLRECRGSSGHELFARGTSEAFAAH